MINSQYTFSPNTDNEFFKTLHKRVNNYFKSSGRNNYGGSRLMLKTAVMLLLFIGPFALLLSGAITSVGTFFLMWVLMAFGITGIGVNVMHDANHGVFSRNKKFNQLVSLVMNVLGGDAAIWRIQHNTLHHSFTNIHGADEDIIGPPMLRFSPHDVKKPIHKHQFIYAWFLYSLMTLIKIAYTDFKRAIRYRKMNLITSRKAYVSRLIKIAGGKILYFGYMLVLPMLLVPFSPWLVLVGFLLMHLVCGFILSIIFQAAHVMPSSEFPVPDENGRMENNWAVHQMLTTTNFSPKSRVFSWFIGGLNYQIEHHLFANISHVHYRKISVLVHETAREYGIPYNCEKSFAHALQNHGKMLYQLGR
ncbi:MAG: acyl-CoA desaturase [Owenweeksia sp.]